MTDSFVAHFFKVKILFQLKVAYEEFQMYLCLKTVPVINYSINND